MIIKEALQYATEKITSTSPVLDAEVLLCFALGKPKEFLYTNPETKLTDKQQELFEKYTERRSTGEPIAYITNEKEFYGRTFYIDNSVLIPRPDTEILIDEVKNYSKSGDIIADVGTGSGCIAITLAKELPNTTVLATDISPDALEVAQKNAKTLDAHVIFSEGNLLKPLTDQKLDIIVANLPYGWKEWKNNTSAETKGLSFEPQIALFTEENGLKLYKELFEQISNQEKKLRLIIGEFDPRQTDELKKIVKNYFPQSTLEIKKDLAGLDRLAIIKL